jgi:hypothetical protein
LARLSYAIQIRLILALFEEVAAKTAWAASFPRLITMPMIDCPQNTHL